MSKKTGFLIVVLYLIPSLSIVSADPQFYETQNTLQPEIAPGAGAPASGVIPSGDPTSDFLEDNPLSVGGGGLPLTPSEMSYVTELMEQLAESVTVSVQSGSIHTSSDSAEPAAGIEKPEGKKVSLNPAVFILNEYAQIKKKMNEPDFESVLTELKSEKEIEEKTDMVIPSPQGIAAELTGTAVMEMKLAVTDRVVEANQNFNLSSEHPFMGWLAMKGVPEDSRKVLTEAEAQRKAMAETVKEAERNGNRVFFIVNGKVVPFFFNIPLFTKGDYQLLILDELSPPASKLS